MSKIYQFRIDLEGAKTPIWRRVQVEANASLFELHVVLQILFGWGNSHLYQFEIDKRFYGNPDFMDDADMNDDRSTQLIEVLKNEGEELVYTYDFGDNWEHNIVLEKILAPEKGVKYPLCIAGKRNTPPEDCGGIWGYEEMLEILKKPKHAEYEDTLEVLGDNFDPEYFDMKALNSILSRLSEAMGDFEEDEEDDFDFLK